MSKKTNRNKKMNSKMSRRMKILLSVLGCVAVCVVVGYVIANSSPAPDDGQPNSNNSSGLADRVDVVYFHRTQRCHTCLYAEEHTVYALETYFADELASGKVTFQSINVEDPANADIVEKYNNASYLTLCVNTVAAGTDHIEVITDIWYEIDNDDAFVEIVKNKVEQGLTGGT